MHNLAIQCANEHITQGWTSDSSQYDIGIYYGDLEAFEEAMGRSVDRTEIKEFEKEIRVEIKKASALQEDQ